MELTAFEKLVRQNRSYRGFDESRKVDREELLRMVDCARLSASSVNLQPLKYYLAWEPEAVGRIQPLTGWARNLPEMTLPHKGMYPTAFIVICQDRPSPTPWPGSRRMWALPPRPFCWRRWRWAWADA